YPTGTRSGRSVPAGSSGSLPPEAEFPDFPFLPLSWNLRRRSGRREEARRYGKRSGVLPARRPRSPPQRRLPVLPGGRWKYAGGILRLGRQIFWKKPVLSYFYQTVPYEAAPAAFFLCGPAEGIPAASRRLRNASAVPEDL